MMWNIFNNLEMKNEFLVNLGTQIEFYPIKKFHYQSVANIYIILLL